MNEETKDIENIVLKALQHDCNKDISELTCNVIDQRSNSLNRADEYSIQCNFQIDTEKHQKSITLHRFNILGDDFENFEKRLKNIYLFLVDLHASLKLITDSNLFARPIYYDMAHDRSIVYEDDTKMFVEPETLNLNQELHVIKALATIHATSVNLLRYSNNLFETSDEKNEFMKTEQYQKACRKIVEILNSFPNRSDWPKLQNLCKLSVEPENIKHELNTDSLNLVALTLSNIRLRYRGCGLFDTKFIVDYANITRGSPLVDLMVFIFTNVPGGKLDSDIPVLLSTYFQRFSEISSYLGDVPAFTLDELLVKFKANLVFGFQVFCVSILARTSRDSEKSESIKCSNAELL